jgi:hypothetical protein
MTAALAMAEALGLNRLIATELLPVIETYAVRGISAQVRATQHYETGSLAAGLNAGSRCALSRPAVRR